MARSKNFRRALQTGEFIFTNPREAARKVRDLMRRGATVYGTRSAMRQVGVQPHHYQPEGASATRKMPDAESELLAQQTDTVAGRVPVSYFPTRSSNRNDPRTSAAGYDPVTHRLYVEWGDHGTPYYYYDVTPQEWDEFQQTPSPGKYINAVLNNKNYGPIEE